MFVVYFAAALNMRLFAKTLFYFINFASGLNKYYLIRSDEHSNERQSFLNVK